jgi:hypothetical protein
VQRYPARIALSHRGLTDSTLWHNLDRGPAVFLRLGRGPILRGAPGCCRQLPTQHRVPPGRRAADFLSRDYEDTTAGDIRRRRGPRPGNILERRPGPHTADQFRPAEQHPR